jgi:hypothetical protein
MHAVVTSWNNRTHTYAARCQCHDRSRSALARSGHAPHDPRWAQIRPVSSTRPRPIGAQIWSTWAWALPACRRAALGPVLTATPSLTRLTVRALRPRAARAWSSSMPYLKSKRRRGSPPSMPSTTFDNSSRASSRSNAFFYGLGALLVGGWTLGLVGIISGTFLQNVHRERYFWE